MDAGAIEHRPILVQTVLMETIANQTELKQVHNGVANVITESLEKTMMLDQKIMAYDERIADIEKIIQATLPLPPTPVTRAGPSLPPPPQTSPAAQ